MRQHFPDIILQLLPVVLVLLVHIVITKTTRADWAEYQIDIQDDQFQQTRYYAVHEPLPFDSTEFPLPSILALHNNISDPMLFVERARLTELSCQERVIVVCPYGIEHEGKKVWVQPDLGLKNYHHEPFLTQLLDTLETDHPGMIDWTRFYIAGNTSGGYVGHYMMFHYPERFAAAALANCSAGVLGTPDSTLDVALIMQHDINDTYTKIERSRYWLRHWVDWIGADVTPVRSHMVVDRKPWVLETYCHPDPDREILYYTTFSDAFHVWARRGSHGIEFTAAMWQFFTRFSQPNALPPGE